MVKNWKSVLGTHLTFLIIIKINLFCCQEEVFILTRTWIIGKILTKQYYLKKKNFKATWIWKIVQMQITYMQRLWNKKLGWVFITQSYFAAPKSIRLSSTHSFVMKIPNKRALQQIPFNHSSDNDFQDLMNLYVLKSHIFFW